MLGSRTQKDADAEADAEALGGGRAKRVSRRSEPRHAFWGQRIVAPPPGIIGRETGPLRLASPPQPLRSAETVGALAAARGVAAQRPARLGAFGRGCVGALGIPTNSFADRRVPHAKMFGRKIHHVFSVF